MFSKLALASSVLAISSFLMEPIKAEVLSQNPSNNNHPELPVFSSASLLYGTVFAQPSQFPNGSAYASQNAPSGVLGNYATVFDNFFLTTPTTIRGVNWQGAYFNGEPGTINGFTLSIYNDKGGQPGSRIFSQYISGNARETFVGNDEANNIVYKYTNELTNPFLAQSNTTYWLSIVPNLAYPPQWGWYGGTGGNGISYQNFFGSLSEIHNDLSFSLLGEATPPITTPEPPLNLGVLVSMVLQIVKAFKRKL